MKKVEELPLKDYPEEVIELFKEEAERLNLPWCAIESNSLKRAFSWKRSVKGYFFWQTISEYYSVS